MSIMSLPEPSWPFGKDWMSMRPPDCSFAAAAMRSTICTCGCVGGSISPQRITVSCARRIAGAARRRRAEGGGAGQEAPAAGGHGHCVVLP